MYALESISRRAQSRHRARILGALGALDAVAAWGVGIVAEMKTTGDVGRVAMRALLNLSAESRNQVTICRRYRNALIAQAQQSKREDLKW